MKIWILYGDNDICMGVYTSMRALKKGVDYWIKEEPNTTLTYTEWKANFGIEPECWEWVYIPKKETLNKLRSGGSDYIPERKYWGKNLVGIKWNSINMK